ncbi:MAG: hypothetical protein CSB06_03675 [Bacteroidia bacterium]|nr:MAG: hypothetical protein CSB06_03675 [Bacteroidia bacterium]
MEIKRKKTRIMIDNITGTILKIIGGAGLFFFTFGFIITIVDKNTRNEAETITVALIFIALNLFIYYKGYKRKQLIKKFKHYIIIISEKQDGRITNIANYTGKPETYIKKQIQSMIKRKYFKNAFIDHSKNSIIIPGLPQIKPENTQKQIKCKNCGASVQYIPEETTVCAYCGSYI